MIFNALEITELKIPPANCLEKLNANLSEFYSIKIYNQWRVIFKWKKDNAFEVEIVDYR